MQKDSTKVKENKMSLNARFAKLRSMVSKSLLTIWRFVNYKIMISKAHLDTKTLDWPINKY